MKPKKTRTFHGMSKHPLYKRWCGMRERCYSEESSNYHNYGGRGIKVCDEWNADYMVYHNHMMGLPNALKNGYTVDRIDNNGNYEPGNVRWVTMHFQRLNQRNTRSTASGYAGVHFKKDLDLYRGEIMVDQQQIYTGGSRSLEFAAILRDIYIIKHGLVGYHLNIFSVEEIENYAKALHALSTTKPSPN